MLCLFVLRHKFDLKMSFVQKKHLNGDTASCSCSRLVLEEQNPNRILFSFFRDPSLICLGGGFTLDRLENLNF